MGGSASSSERRAGVRADWRAAAARGRAGGGRQGFCLLVHV
jgi:hypothetical protein